MILRLLPNLIVVAAVVVRIYIRTPAVVMGLVVVRFTKFVSTLFSVWSIDVCVSVWVVIFITMTNMFHFKSSTVSVLSFIAVVICGV